MTTTNATGYTAGAGLVAVAASDADTDSCRELDALAEFSGLNLRLENDAEAPMPWAVWGSDGIEAEDIAGAGVTASEAIEDARNQIRTWVEAARG